MVAVLQVSTLVVLALLGMRLTYGVGYFAGLGVAAGLFAYQQKLIRDRNPARCLAAFRNNVWVGFALFVGTVIELELPLRLQSFGGT
jgi:4-hydroxybenzoate polyprenyltransferase